MDRQEFYRDDTLSMHPQSVAWWKISYCQQQFEQSHTAYQYQSSRDNRHAAHMDHIKDHIRKVKFLQLYKECRPPLGNDEICNLCWGHIWSLQYIPTLLKGMEKIRQQSHFKRNQQPRATHTGYTCTGTMDMGVQRKKRQTKDNSNRYSTFHRKAFAIHFKINPKKEHGTTKEATHDPMFKRSNHWQTKFILRV